MIFSQFIDAQKTKRFKEKSGEPLEYREDIELNADIYKDSWPLAQHMTWYIPASARDADTVSIGDGGSDSQQSMSNQSGAVEEIVHVPVYTEDEDYMISQQYIGPARSKSRGKSDGFESTFASVAASLTGFITQQNEQQKQKIETPPQSTLKYAQMFEELDKALEGVPSLAAFKFPRGR